ncbi:MAG: hypothetical protein V4726_12490 [Verrucomicrobiota bacterium]
MNPYEPPQSAFAPHRRTGNFHGVLAGILMVLALAIKFGVPLVRAYNHSTEQDASTFLLSLAITVFWIWGCCHLAKHLGLSAAWGLSGILFLLGLVVIFWAARENDKWRRQGGRPATRRKEYRGDPDSPY